MKKTIIFISQFLLYFIVCFAHEEPSKTLYEKKDKKEQQMKIYKSKIKSTAIWKYSFENNTESSLKNKAFILEYDNNGDFTAIEAYNNDSIQERDEYTYNPTGDMLTEIDFSSDGKIIEKNNFIYDTEGRVIYGETRTAKDSLLEYFKIIPSSDRKNIVFNKYKKNNEIEYKIVYKYAKDFDSSDFIEAIKYDSAGKIIMKAEKEYDMSGKQIKKIVYNDSLKVSHIFLYEYNDNGNRSAITKKLADGSISWKDYYFYDRSGNCTEVKSYNSGNILISHLQYIYEYYKQ